MKLYIGIDWSQSKHDVCFLNHAGVIQAQAVIEHSPAGFGKFEKLCRQLGVRAEDCLIGLETAHNILVDFLWDCGYTQIYVLPPSLVKGSG